MTTTTNTNAAGATSPALDTLLAMQPRLDAQAAVRNADIERHEREGRETKMRLLTPATPAGAKQPATIADTPEKVSSFMLLALKGALYLESKGMKRRGHSALAVARAQFPGIVTGKTAAKALPQLIAQLKSMGVLA